MAEKWSVVIAFIVHFLFRIALFVRFPVCDNCLGVLPSLMVLASVTVTLLDSCVLPKKFKGLPGMKAVEVGVEAVLCLVFMELAMGFVWSPIENIANFVLKQAFKNVYGPRLAQFIATTILSAVATQILSFTLIATKNMQAVKGFFENTMMSLIGMSCRQRQAPVTARKPVPLAANQCSPCPQPSAARHRGAGDQAQSSSPRNQSRC